MDKLSVLGLSADYRSGRRRPREVLEQAYARIAEHGERPAWIALRPLEEALSVLERAEATLPDAPLLGIPFAVKDNIDVAGLPTTAACPEFSYLPARSAAVVERLEAAGAIALGKTNLDQFATGLVGTRSPYGVCSSVFDARYISGGSSSGSAVAVARGDVAFALGTDTAGSGRVPALFNALVGLKPTRGVFSTRGVVPACRSLDCVSLFTGDLDDAALLFGLCEGFDADDPFSRALPSLSGLGARVRLGVPSKNSLEFFGDEASAAQFAASVERLSQLPAELVEIDLTPFRSAAELLYQGPWVAERLAAVGGFVEARPDAVHPVVRDILLEARGKTARATFEGLYRLQALKRETERVWQEVDALVVPTAPSHYTIEEVLAEPRLLNQQLGTYTNFVNLLDLSALAVPDGFKPNGLPFGVTFLAPAFHDERLLELAARAAGKPAPAPSAPKKGRVWLAVAGAHLSGQPLNHELTTRGARLVRETRTAQEYQLFALRTTPPKPGLVHSPGEGRAIDVEVWELDEGAFGSFVAAVPAPMTIGTVALEDGARVKGFSCEPRALVAAEDISRFGGWVRYLEQR